MSHIPQMLAASDFRCPACDSTHLDSVVSRALEHELLECQECRRVYAMVRAPDGTMRLVSM
jgi:hypothetical protein